MSHTDLALPPLRDPDSAPSVGQEHLPRTVLVVDDELPVREIVRRLLVHQRFNVLTAGSVAEAVDLMERTRGAVDLVLTDITMPEQNGWALFRIVRERWPRTDLLFMSGHHHSLLETESGEFKPAVLAKPFTMESLTAAVHLALET